MRKPDSARLSQMELPWADAAHHAQHRYTTAAREKMSGACGERARAVDGIKLTNFVATESVDVLRRPARTAAQTQIAATILASARSKPRMTCGT
jgi:hypothetical protein